VTSLCMRMSNHWASRHRSTSCIVHQEKRQKIEHATVDETFT
jgi:hypothetical protein